MRALSGQVARPVGAAAARGNCLKAAVALPQSRLAPRQDRDHDAPAESSWGREPELTWLPVSPPVQQAASPAAKHLYAAAPRAGGGARPHQAAHLAALLERTSFAVQLNEPPQQRDKQKHADYYANVGDAIRTLRDDIPLLFAKELNYGIYREDVVFSQPPRLSFKGLKNYKLIFWSLRFHGRLFFSRLTVDVLRIWQPEDSVIKMRWRVHAVPRVWWEAEGTFDGVSTYKLDQEGVIYEHAVDNMQLRDPPITNPLLYAYNYILRPRLQPQQMPIPGSWFAEFAERGQEEAPACTGADPADPSPA